MALRAGIGLGIAQQLLKDGFRVIASGRSIDRLTSAFGTAGKPAITSGQLLCVVQLTARAWH